jgi:hypothetical protein
LQLGAPEVTARPLNTSTCAAVARAGRRGRSGGWGRRRGWLRALAAALACWLLTGCGSGSSQSARSLLKETFGSRRTISSGRIDLSLTLAARGHVATKGAGGFSLGLTGPFQSAGAGRVPSFALTFTLDTAGHRLRTGAVATAGRLYLELGGLAFLAPRSSTLALEHGYAQAAAGSSAPASRSPLATLGVDPGAWLSHPSIAGSASLGGEDTVHIVTGLDAARFLADAQRLAEAGGALAAGRPAGLLTPARAAALSASARSGRVDVYTGARDHLLRRLALRAAIDAGSPARRNVLGGLGEGTLTFTLALAELNRPQAIAAPAHPQPLSRLARVLEGNGPAIGLVPGG